MKKALRFSWVLLILVFAVSYFEYTNLENVTGILSELEQEPQQEENSEEEFIFDYRGTDYLVEPVADYELYGLVVSHNDIHAFSDIYHTDDSVDIKDLCVIWGENVEGESFKKMEFWSEPWTCWARRPRERNFFFDMNQLSNNHVLSDNQSVRDTIHRMHIGDQIYLKGMLVNYKRAGTSDFFRNSSTVRDDEGNGACEVMFVDEARILKEGISSWRMVHVTAKRLLLVLLVFSLGHFLYEAYRPMFK